jgi:hypothetical protein
MKNKLSIAMSLTLIMALMTTVTAFAATRTITYTGQGFFDDGGGTFLLNSERCGLEGQSAANDGGTGQFADWNGPGNPYQTGQPYLVWVLSLNASPAGGVTINLPDGSHAMFQVGGTWKYASPYWDRNVLVNLPVTATFDDAGIKASVLKTVNLVVSHGCPPREEEGAWCSPGYWRNAADAAWALTGYAKTDLFNLTVVPNFYDTASAANPTLIQVLTTPGANTFGAASGPYGLNAFNATGAFLTDQIPGFFFDPALVGLDRCPINNAGEFKP